MATVNYLGAQQPDFSDPRFLPLRIETMNGFYFGTLNVTTTGFTVTDVRFFTDGSQVTTIEVITDNATQLRITDLSEDASSLRTFYEMFGPMAMIERVLSGNDSVTENEAGARYLAGYAGDDRITGAARRPDTLDGGIGDDTLIPNVLDVVVQGTFQNIRHVLIGGTDSNRVDTDVAELHTDFVADLVRNHETDPDRLVYGLNGGGVEMEGIESFVFNDASFTLPEMQRMAGYRFDGTAFNDRLTGDIGHDTIFAGNGQDTIVGGTGDDVIHGGQNQFDLRDVIFAGDGDDSIDAGAGNDEVHGGEGDDTILGGTGADTLIGNHGRDVISGGALGDYIHGGGRAFINGGFGSDRLEGGQFYYHAGVAGHGNDWIKGFSGWTDYLIFGGQATASDFQVNYANTAQAGTPVDEAFVIYRPTGQILWALVDGERWDEINVLLGGPFGPGFDILA